MLIHFLCSMVSLLTLHYFSCFKIKASLNMFSKFSQLNKWLMASCFAQSARPDFTVSVKILERYFVMRTYPAEPKYC